MPSVVAPIVRVFAPINVFVPTTEFTAPGKEPFKFLVKDTTNGNIGDVSVRITLPPSAMKSMTQKVSAPPRPNDLPGTPVSLP